LAPLKRQKLFLQIIKNCLGWSVGIVSHTEIDELGIIRANSLAFEKAISKINIEPDYLIIDGVKIFEPSYEYEFVIKGDAKIASVAAASIIAKVVRDELLKYYAKLYPEYNFQEHKGYGTENHRYALEKHGLSEIHRITYKPIEEILNVEIN